MPSMAEQLERWTATLSAWTMPANFLPVRKAANQYGVKLTFPDNSRAFVYAGTANAVCHFQDTGWE